MSRTRHYSLSKPPCDEAVREKGDWFVEIPDLDALLAFIARHGELVIGPHHSRDELSIEIYDGYRE